MEDFEPTTNIGFWNQFCNHGPAAVYQDFHKMVSDIFCLYTAINLQFFVHLMRIWISIIFHLLGRLWVMWLLFWLIMKVVRPYGPYISAISRISRSPPTEFISFRRSVRNAIAMRSVQKRCRKFFPISFCQHSHFNAKSSFQEFSISDNQFRVPTQKVSCSELIRV